MSGIRGYGMRLIVGTLLGLLLPACAGGIRNDIPPAPLGLYFTKTSSLDTGVGTFADALRTDELSGLVDTLNGPGPFTAFVPPNDTFDEWFEELNITKEEFLASEELESIIKYYIINELILRDDLVDGATFTTLEGSTISVTVNENGTFLNGDVQMDEPIPNTKGIIITNGTLHSIFGVLSPPGFSPSGVDSNED